MAECVTLVPDDCSEAELDEFETLAISAGKVTPIRLRELIRLARLLAFLREGDMLIGVAGLKRPRDSYRERVAARSGVPLPVSAYPYELGWVSVLPAEIGGKSKLLCEPLLASTPGEGVFSTTGVGNDKMRSRLAKMGFKEAGQSWKSAGNEETLSLFVLPR